MKHIVSVALFATATACGGGGGGDVSAPGGNTQYLSSVAGQLQLAKPGSSLADQLVVQVTDAQRQPVAGVTITWSTADGAVTPPSVKTGADGRAAANWTLGPGEGIQEATASAASGAHAVFQGRAIGSSRPIAFGAREWMHEPLRMMNADGTGLVQLTAVPAYSPAWSPDGKRLAFMVGSPTSCSQSFGDLFVFDFTTITETQLTRNDRCSRVDHPVWSPDGRVIAFADEQNWRIVFVNADGSGTRSFSIAGGIEADPILVAPVGKLFWSPDGTTLMFGGKGKVSRVLGGGAVWSVSVDGTGLRPLDTLTAWPQAFSPDRSALGLSQHLEPHTDKSRILVVDPANMDVARPVTGPSGIFEFAWSPSGDQWLADVYGLANPCGDPNAPTLILYDYDKLKNQLTEKIRFPTCGANATWRP